MRQTRGLVAASRWLTWSASFPLEGSSRGARAPRGPVTELDTWARGGLLAAHVVRLFSSRGELTWRTCSTRPVRQTRGLVAASLWLTWSASLPLEGSSRGSRAPRGHVSSTRGLLVAHVVRLASSRGELTWRTWRTWSDFLFAFVGFLKNQRRRRTAHTTRRQ